MAGYLGLSEIRVSAINDKVLHFVIFGLLTVRPPESPATLTP
jgi:hypothetical protein